MREIERERELFRGCSIYKKCSMLIFIFELYWFIKEVKKKELLI
jgi:hypothetical protein